MAAAVERVEITVGFPGQLPDEDPAETEEWLESLDGLVDHAGRTRVRALLLCVLLRARERQVDVPSALGTDYVNTIAPGAEPEFPGDESIGRRLCACSRWNAAVMVHRAQRPDIGVGGHISTYASAADLYEVGFNHFFRGHAADDGGDQIFFQGHASPGIYARAFLEGRLSELQLDGFRQELSHGGLGAGLPSYPHPRLMPGFWEFPTVSMGLGPLYAICQRTYPEQPPRSPYVARRLGDAPSPVIAVSDWMWAVPDQIARFVPGSWSSLGTDGFGRSDARPALRRHFGVDAPSIVLRTLEQLIAGHEMDGSVRDKALGAYGVEAAGDPNTGTRADSAR